jgi:fumarate hydratase class I
MVEFSFHPLYETGKSETKYRELTRDHVSVGEFEGHRIVKVAPAALSELARQALSDVNYFYRTRHLESLGRILGEDTAQLSGYRHGDRLWQEGPADLDRWP